MKNIIKISLLFSLSFLFVSCASKNLDSDINDLKKYKQDINHYTKDLPYFDKNIQNKLDKKFNERYFKPWHIDKIPNSLEDATWQFKYAKQKIYGDNHRLLSKEWFNKQIDNSNFERYNTFLRKAITVKNSNLRVFPTISKLFYNPKKAGEGFPFDYNQNSGIKINSPILISHFSKDRAWVYVFSAFANGWLSVNDIAYVDKKIIEFFENDNYYIAIRDMFPIYKKGIFVEYIKLGTLFPIKNNKAIIIGRDTNNQGFIRALEIEDIYIEKKPLDLNKKNISLIGNQLINEPYGWGELLNHRDCSAFTKDFVAPFGIFLNRNSYGQTFDGKYTNISTLSNKEKKEYILKNAIPFLSLVYLKGHIMLYIGEENSEPIFFHNVWGVKTKNIFGKEGRKVVGKAVITTLNMGEELSGFDESKSLLSRVIGLVNLNQEREKK